MKLLLVLCLIALTHAATAQNSNPWPTTGNVGIGTSNPLTLLHVAIPVSKTNLTPSTANIASFFMTNDGVGPFGLRTMIFGGNTIDSRTVTLQTTERNVFDGGILSLQGAAGNVGVGTLTPKSLLDVGKLLSSGEMSVVLARLTEGNTTGNGTYLGVRGYDTQPASGSDPAKVKSFAIEHSFYGSTNSSINFFRGIGYTGGSIAFNTDQNIERMRILGNGNVGIGTESPDQKLTVNGTIHSSAVKVDTSIPVPDYVFDIGYKLPNLSETKAYVSKFHHLPGVPSGKEMEKEGIDLGRMNLVLLKKVEELTLHLIEQDKRIARLEAEKRHKR